MKIVLIQNTTYIPTKGGSDKSNKILLENLASCGHECSIIVPATAVEAPGVFEKFVDLAMEISGMDMIVEEDKAVFTVNNVTIHALKSFSSLSAYLVDFINANNPDWIFVPSDDFAQMLLESAVKTAASRVIYLARTTLTLPFGPDAYLKLPKKTALVQKVRGIMAVSHFIKDYIHTWSGAKAHVLPISLYGKGPFHRYDNYETGAVTMINPCAYKGISIFLALAAHFPGVPFLAIASWGTTPEDLASMARYKNIRIMDSVEDVEIVYRQTKVLLVPSLWAEAKARSIGEAMLRGIPVIASDVGGNREAKSGVDYCLPVKRISTYHYGLDKRKLPMAEVPEQDVAPWCEALGRLLAEKDHYRSISVQSAVNAFEHLVKDNGIERVEKYLLTLKLSEDKNREVDYITA